MNILFLCVANSARSQMAEGLAKKILSEHHIESAGSVPSGIVHPDAISAMKEIGIDISNHHSKHFEDFPDEFKKNLDYVITLCAEESCPVMASKAEKLHWALPDPADADPKQRIQSFREIRNEIETRLKEFKKNLPQA